MKINEIFDNSHFYEKLGEDNLEANYRFNLDEHDVQILVDIVSPPEKREVQIDFDVLNDEGHIDASFKESSMIFSTIIRIINDYLKDHPETDLLYIISDSRKKFEIYKKLLLQLGENWSVTNYHLDLYAEKNPDR